MLNINALCHNRNRHLQGDGQKMKESNGKIFSRRHLLGDGYGFFSQMPVNQSFNL